MSKPSDLGSSKIGSSILLPNSDQPSGEPCKITEYDTSKPGKHGAAKARIVAEGIFDGQKRPHIEQIVIRLNQACLLSLRTFLECVIHFKKLQMTKIFRRYISPGYIDTCPGGIYISLGINIYRTIARRWILMEI